MSNSLLKFNRPSLKRVLSPKSAPAVLAIVGDFPDATVEEAYSGGVDLENAVGLASVRIVSGGPLPPGYTLAVDNSVEPRKIRITWPAYAVDSAPITNPEFDDLDEGWELGPGWYVTGVNPIAGLFSAAYKNNGGSSIISSLSRYLVDPGTTINAQCLVRQGASSAGNAGAGVRVEFRDPDTLEVVAYKDGNMVMSAYNNAVYPSNVAATSPTDGPTLANIAANGLRRRQNLDVWVDSFQWDLEVATAGTNTPGTLTFVLEAKDSLGQVARRTMTIEVEGVAPPTVAGLELVQITGHGMTDIGQLVQSGSSSPSTMYVGRKGSGAYTTGYRYSTSGVASTLGPGAVTGTDTLVALYDGSFGCMAGDGGLLRRNITGSTWSTLVPAWGSGEIVTAGRFNSEFLGLSDSGQIYVSSGGAWSVDSGAPSVSGPCYFVVPQDNSLYRTALIRQHMSGFIHIKKNDGTWSSGPAGWPVVAAQGRSYSDTGTFVIQQHVSGTGFTVLELTLEGSWVDRGSIGTSDPGEAGATVRWAISGPGDALMFWESSSGKQYACDAVFGLTGTDNPSNPTINMADRPPPVPHTIVSGSNLFGVLASPSGADLYMVKAP